MVRWRGYAIGATAVVAAGGLAWAVATDERGPTCLAVPPSVSARIVNGADVLQAAAVHAPWIERRDQQYGYDTYHVLALRFTTSAGEEAVGTWAYASDGTTTDVVPEIGTLTAVGPTAERWSPSSGGTSVIITPDEKAVAQAIACLA